jgi:TPR repeat protein
MVSLVACFEALGALGWYLQWPKWAVVLLLALGPVGALASFAQRWLERHREEQEEAKNRQRVIDSSLGLSGPPLVEAVSALQAGATEEHITPDNWSRKQAQRYVQRSDTDEDLRNAIRTCPFVLVVGPSKAGKSRSAFEAAKQVWPQRKLIYPSERFSLRELLSLDPPLDFANSVVWLDNLQRFLPDSSGTGITEHMLNEFHELGDAVVVATMRLSEYAKFKDANETMTRDVENLLRRAQPAIRLEPLMQLPSDLRSLDLGFAEEVERVGLGAALVLGPDLVDRLENPLENADSACGVAVVRAAMDWFRVGITTPVPESMLSELFEVYLPPDCDEVPDDPFAAGLAWARQEVLQGAKMALVMLHDKGPPPRFVVSEYLLEHTIQGDSPVPLKTWRHVVQHADVSVLATVGLTAYMMGKEMNDASKRADFLSVAQAAWVRAATEGGETRAMFNLGVLLAELGDSGEAEGWYRQAAEAGHTKAMSNLGVLLDERGDRGEAEGWYRQAAAAGETLAMVNLGVLLDERGATDEAEHWYRQAAEAGHREAMSNLGVLLAKRGDTGEAKRWTRQAAAAGETGEKDKPPSGRQ